MKQSIKFINTFIKKITNIENKIIDRFKSIISQCSKTALLISILAIFFAICVIGGFYYLQNKIKQPLSPQENYQIFVISNGETVKEIAENLEKSKLINNSVFFLIYFKQLEKSFSHSLTIKAGSYKLSPHLNIPEIIERLIYGLVEFQGVKIVIPEGYNIFEIGEKLEEAKLLSSKEFLEAARLKEGYFFPDTYQFSQKSNAEVIISKISANFDNKISSLGLGENTDLNKIIILASLLEKEVANYKDRQIVAGILWKRAEEGMRLQVDSTVLYAKMLKKYESGEDVIIIGQNHNPVSIEDTNINSLYNTYKNQGLPAGPICNPGINSIKAALNPIETDYWYYLSTKDGRTIFSKTYEEHLKNKEEYL